MEDAKEAAQQALTGEAVSEAQEGGLADLLATLRPGDYVATQALADRSHRPLLERPRVDRGGV